MTANNFKKDKQYFKFCAYGFLKNLRFYDAFLLLFFVENGLTYSQIGILYALREIVVNVSEIPSGIIADTYGRKNALLAAFLSYICSFLAFYYSVDFSLLLLAMILYGLGDAFRSGTHKGMIIDYLKLNGWENHKISYYGLTRSWSQKGSAISALFAGFLVLYSGSYRIVYLVSIIPYLLNLINVWTYPKILNHTTSEKKKRIEKSFISVFKLSFSTIKDRSVFQVINSAALHSAFLKAIKDYIQPVMLQLAILFPLLEAMDIKRKSGLIIGVIYFFIFILNSYASRVSVRATQLGIKDISKVTLLLGLASGIVCGVFVAYELWALSLLPFILIYLIENIRKPILTGILADSVPNEILTSVISAQSFYRSFITSVIAIFFGFFADKFGLGISFISTSCILLFFVFWIRVSPPQPCA